MAININDPRVTKEGRRILIDDIPVRTWVYGIGIDYSTFHRLQAQGMSISDIEAKYKGREKVENKKRTVQYLDREWTISELHRECCRKDIAVDTLRYRIFEQKWDIERALTEPPRPRRGREVKYKGKTYSSIGKLCSIVGVSGLNVHRLMRSGISLEEAIEQVSSVEIPTVLYKGQQVRIASLVDHPDNIHKLDYDTIITRIRAYNYTPEEALTYPKRKIKLTSFTYNGKEYDSKKDLTLALNLGYSDYLKLSGLDPDTPEFIEMVDKLIASK